FPLEIRPPRCENSLHPVSLSRTGNPSSAVCRNAFRRSSSGGADSSILDTVLNPYTGASNLMARDDDKDTPDGGDDTKKRSAKGPPGTFYGYPIPFWINSLLGKPLLLIGLLAAVVGRGCDATGMRSVARSDAAYRQATIAFDLEWDAKAADKRLTQAK